MQYLVSSTNKNLAMQTDHVSAAHTICQEHLCDLEIYVNWHSKSLEMEPLSRSYTTYY